VSRYGRIPPMLRPGTIQFVIRFRGGDFESWKAAFAAHEPQRVKHGAVGHWIARSTEDPNAFFGVVEFTSHGGARAYAEDADRLDVQRALMMEGGPHQRTWDESIVETIDLVMYEG
jgi:hypothetical protein